MKIPDKYTAKRRKWLYRLSQKLDQRDIIQILEGWYEKNNWPETQMEKLIYVVKKRDGKKISGTRRPIVLFVSATVPERAPNTSHFAEDQHADV